MKFPPHALRRLLSVGVLLSLSFFAGVSRLSANDASGLFCFFEDFSDASGAVNSGPGSGIIPFVGGTHQVKDVARFGAGALSIQPESGVNRGGLKLNFSSGELPELSHELESFTICLWMQPQTDHAGMMAWRIPRNVSTPGGFLFGHNKEGLFYFMSIDADGTAGRAFSPSVKLTPGEWVHIAITFDRGHIAFYINGEQQGPVRQAGIKAVPEGELGSTYLTFFHGTDAGTLVDDLGFFVKSALLPQEIESIFTNGLQGYLAKP